MQHASLGSRVAPDRVKSHTQVCGDRLCGGRGAINVLLHSDACNTGVDTLHLRLRRSCRYRPVLHWSLCSNTYLQC